MYRLSVDRVATDIPTDTSVDMSIKAPYRMLDTIFVGLLMITFPVLLH